MRRINSCLPTIRMLAIVVRVHSAIYCLLPGSGPTLSAISSPDFIVSKFADLLAPNSQQIGRPLPSAAPHPILYAAITVSWTTPPVYGGAVIAAFVVRWLRIPPHQAFADQTDTFGKSLWRAKEETAGDWEECRVGGDVREHVVSNLQPGSMYQFAVAAVAGFTPHPLAPADSAHVRRVTVQLPCCGGREMQSEPVHLLVPRRPGPCSAGRRLSVGVACVCALDIPVSPMKESALGKENSSDALRQPPSLSGYAVEQRYCSNSLAIWWHTPRQFGSIRITGYRVVVIRGSSSYPLPAGSDESSYSDVKKQLEELSVSVDDARLVGHLVRSAGRCALASRHNPERPHKLGGDSDEAAAAAEVASAAAAGSQVEAWAGHVAWRHEALSCDIQETAGVCCGVGETKTFRMQCTARAKVIATTDEESESRTRKQYDDSEKDESDPEFVKTAKMGDNCENDGEICACLLPLLGASILEVMIRSLHCCLATAALLPVIVCTNETT